MSGPHESPSHTSACPVAGAVVSTSANADKLELVLSASVIPYPDIVVGFVPKSAKFTTASVIPYPAIVVGFVPKSAKFTTASVIPYPAIVVGLLVKLPNTPSNNNVVVSVKSLTSVGILGVFCRLL